MPLQQQRQLKLWVLYFASKCISPQLTSINIYAFELMYLQQLAREFCTIHGRVGRSLNINTRRCQSHFIPRSTFSHCSWLPVPTVVSHKIMFWTHLSIFVIWNFKNILQFINFRDILFMEFIPLWDIISILTFVYHFWFRCFDTGQKNYNRLSDLWLINYLNTKINLKHIWRLRTEQ
jgi:hypothetical protein